MSRFVLVSLFVCGAVAAHAQGASSSPQTSAAHPDFTGSWTLDTARSHGEGMPVSMTLRVTQTGSTLTADRVAGTPMGDVHDTVVVPLDGSSVTSSTSTNMKWTTAGSWDGAVLVITKRADLGDGNAISQVERWSLVDGGKGMRVESTMSAGGQSAQVTLALLRVSA